MSIKSYLMKKMMASKLKDVPQEQQDKIFAAMDKNPQLFQQIAAEVQEKMKGGKDQMAAAMEVMQKHQEELKGIL